MNRCLGFFAPPFCSYYGFFLLKIKIRQLQQRMLSIYHNFTDLMFIPF